jgi:hypothetical protein
MDAGSLRSEVLLAVNPGRSQNAAPAGSQRFIIQNADFILKKAGQLSIATRPGFYKGGQKRLSLTGATSAAR